MHHRNYVKSENAQTSHGASGGYNDEACVKLTCLRENKGMTRSQSEPPGFDIWDVQRSLILRGEIYVLLNK